MATLASLQVKFNSVQQNNCLRGVIFLARATHLPVLVLDGDRPVGYIGETQLSRPNYGGMDPVDFDRMTALDVMEDICSPLYGDTEATDSTLTLMEDLMLDALAVIDRATNQVTGFVLKRDLVLTVFQERVPHEAATV